MKKFLKIFFSIVFVVAVLGIIFCIIDSLKVRNDEEPIFTFSHKILDGDAYYTKVDVGLGYKIVRLYYKNQSKIKIGSIFMSEKMQDIIDENNLLDESNRFILSGDSGESGETVVKMTTFGEKYKATVPIEGMEEEVNAQNINSKIGYSMEYYYELFDYVGYEDHDKYSWYGASGDIQSTLTIYNISNEEAYKESLENITKEGMLEEISGDSSEKVQKIYYRSFKENEINKVNYVYILWFDDLKLMVDWYMPQEAQEGIGAYMRRMTQSIHVE